jgi:hypothetical protein
VGAKKNKRANMDLIEIKLKQLQETFSLKLYLNDRVNEPVEINTDNSNNFQKYELDLFQSYLIINQYANLELDLITWPEPKKYSLDNNDLIEHIQMRLGDNLSIDMTYFYNELIYHLLEKNQKRNYSSELLENLKKIINYKLNNDYDLELILRLLYRFIFVSKLSKFENEEFLKATVQTILKCIDIENEFYISFNFFENIYTKTRKNDKYRPILINFYDKFSNLIEKKLLSDSSNIHIASRIASIYGKCNNEKRKVYFYKIDIDYAIDTMQDISKDTAMRYQSILEDKLKIANQIRYKQKEIKSLLQRTAKFISENYGSFFQGIQDDEVQKIVSQYFEAYEHEYKKVAKDKEKIDFILFYIFHLSYYSVQYEVYLKNKKSDDFLETFLPIKKITDHKGYSHTIEDVDSFGYFNSFAQTNNNLFLYLDHKYNWVDISLNILLEDIESLNMIDGNKEQFKKAINLFDNQQYMEFMYMAPALIEMLLKNYLIKINGDILSAQRGSLVEKSCNQVINELKNDENSYLDKNILDYIAYAMVENHGLNLRNNISHGNFPDGAYNKSNSMYLYIILTYLIKYFENDQD